MAMSNLQASNLFNVNGLVAVITGGGSGLGRIMALALDTNGAAKVFIIGRREDALNETVLQGPNGSIIAVPGDVTSQASLQAAYTTIAAQTEHIDLLIVNSGILGPRARMPPDNPDGSKASIAEIRDYLWSIPMADFAAVFDVNTTGAYYTAVAFLPLLDAANKRRPAPEKNKMSAPLPQVIFITSVAAYARAAPYDIAYNLSKAATNHLVKILATSFKDYGLRFNGIAPGLFQSEMAQDMSDGDKGVSDGSFSPSRIPITRAGAEEDLAGLVVWMASASGGYLHGNVTVIDGGRLSTLQSSY